MTIFWNTTINNNDGANMVFEISKFMLIDVRNQNQEYQNAFDALVAQALEALRKEVGEGWNEGAKNVLHEQLLYIAQPSQYKPNHEIRYVVEFTAIEQGDEDCEAWSKYRAWELSGIEQLEMYVHHLKGGDVIEWLRVRWESQKQEMRHDMVSWGHNFDRCPIDNDEDLVEEHRRLREWWYSDEDQFEVNCFED
jgi:hypothetical protein